MSIPSDFALTVKELKNLGFVSKLKTFVNFNAYLLEDQLYWVYYSHIENNLPVFEEIFKLLLQDAHRDAPFVVHRYNYSGQYFCHPPIFWKSIRSAFIKRRIDLKRLNLPESVKYFFYHLYYQRLHPTLKTFPIHSQTPHPAASQRVPTPSKRSRSTYTSAPSSHKRYIRSSSHLPVASTSTSTILVSGSSYHPSHRSPVSHLVPLMDIDTQPFPVPKSAFLAIYRDHVSTCLPVKLFWVDFLQSNLAQFNDSFTPIFHSVAAQLFILLPLVQPQLDSHSQPLAPLPTLRAYLASYPILPYLLFPFLFTDSVVHDFLSVSHLILLQDLDRKPLLSSQLSDLRNASSTHISSLSSSSSPPPTSTTSFNPHRMKLLPSSPPPSPVKTVRSQVVVVPNPPSVTSSSTSSIWTPVTYSSTPTYPPNYCPPTPGRHLPVSDSISADTLDLGSELDSSLLYDDLD
jgi:hypothetical protein